MTMRKVPAGGLWVPYPVSFIGNIATVHDGLFLSDDDGITKACFTIACPASGVLSGFEVYIDPIADPSTTIKFSFQDLDSNGKPDGVADEYRIVEVGDILSIWFNPGLITSDGTDTGTPRTVTRGQKLGLVVEFDSVNPSDYITLGTIRVQDDSVRRMPFGGQFYSGVWNVSESSIGLVALRYDESPNYKHLPEAIPSNGLQQTTINTGTTPDEVGLIFSFPAPVRIGGASICLSATGTPALDCVVYDQSNTVIDTISMKMRPEIFNPGGYSYWTARFSSDILVPGNENYKITVKPSSTASVKLLELSFSDSAILADVYGYLDTGGNEHNWRHVERTDGGTFSPLTLLPLISINVTGIDMDAGGATDDWTGDA